jgi:hypothetical protein
MRSILSGLRVSCVCLFAVTGGLAEPPEIEGVDPPQGYANESTLVTLSGAGFELGSSIALLGGGPFAHPGGNGIPRSRSMTVEGDLGYLATYWHGLMILDLEDPLEPMILGQVDLVGDDPYDVAVAGQHAFVGTNGSGLEVVDVGDPYQPAWAGSLEIPSRYCAIVAKDGYLFGAAHADGLVVLDISQPTAPFVVASLDLPWARDLAVAEDRLFVAHGGMHVVDIADPRAPLLLGEVPIYNGANAVEAFQAPLALWAMTATASSEYESFQWGAIQATGVPNTAGCGDDPAAWAPASDGAGPEYLEVGFPRATPATGIRIHESYNSGFVYQVDLVDADGGEHTIWTGTDTTSCPGILELTWDETPYAVKGARIHTAKEGWEEIDAVELITAGSGQPTDYALVGGGGVFLVDPADPHEPVILSRHEWISTGDVAVRDGLGYAVGGTWARYGLHVFDVRRPPDLTWVGRTRLPEDARGIALAEDAAYVMGTTTGLEVIDVSDPRTPAPVAMLGTSIWMEDIEASGDYGYGLGSELVVFDVSIPTAPYMSGSLFSAQGTDIEVVGNHAFAVEGQGLHSFDVSGTDPVYLHSDSWGYGTRALAIDGAHVYVAAERYLQVYYVGNPHHIWSIGRSRYSPYVSRTGTGIAISGSLVFVTTGSDYGGDLQVFSTWPIDWTWIGGGPIAVEAVGDFAYVAVHRWDWWSDEDEGLLCTFELPLPSPSIVSHGCQVVERGTDWHSYDYSYKMAVQGQRLLLTTSSGVLEYDISTPERPVLTGGFRGAGGGRSVATTGNIAWATVDNRILQGFRLNPRPIGVSTPDASTFTFTVPPGYTEGPYDVVVTNPDGERTIMPNGLHICRPRVLTATLGPVWGGQAPEAAIPVQWRLALDGDDVFFDPFPGHDGRLLLPTLPGNVETELVEGGEPGRGTIDLFLFPDDDLAMVRLTGTDPDRLARRWERIASAGGIGLPARDDRRYGDITLGIRPPADAGGPPPDEAGVTEGVPWGDAPFRFRYVLEGDRLMEAMAEGPEVDLILEARARDDSGCSFISEVSFREALKALCAQLPEQPWLLSLCSQLD